MLLKHLWFWSLEVVPLIIYHACFCVSISRCLFKMLLLFHFCPLLHVFKAVVSSGEDCTGLQWHSCKPATLSRQDQHTPWLTNINIWKSIIRRAGGIEIAWPEWKHQSWWTREWNNVLKSDQQFLWRCKNTVRVPKLDSFFVLQY